VFCRLKSRAEPGPIRYAFDTGNHDPYGYNYILKLRLMEILERR
jgi:hypothetical protein